MILTECDKFDKISTILLYNLKIYAIIQDGFKGNFDK